MPRPKLSINAAFKLLQVQTLTGIPANSTADFVLSARGAQTEWYYDVVNRALPASFVISHAWCSALNSVVVRMANVTATSAAIGSASFEIVGL